MENLRNRAHKMELLNTKLEVFVTEVNGQLIRCHNTTWREGDLQVDYSDELEFPRERPPGQRESLYTGRNCQTMVPAETMTTDPFGLNIGLSRSIRRTMRNWTDQPPLLKPVNKLIQELR